MPIKPKRIINWYEIRQCWRKKYKGKMYYLATGGICKGEDDVEGYSIALAEFAEIKKRIAEGLPPRPSDGRTTPAVRPLDIALPTKSVAAYHDYSSDPDELPQASLS